MSKLAIKENTRKLRVIVFAMSLSLPLVSYIYGPKGLRRHTAASPIS